MVPIPLITTVLKWIVAPVIIFNLVSGWGLEHSIPAIISYLVATGAAFGTINVTARIPV